MKTARWMACSIVMAATTAIGSARAQVPDVVWDALRDRPVIVEKHDGSTVEGKLAGVDPESVVVQIADGRSAVIERAAIKNVRARAGAAPPSALPPPAPPQLPDLDKLLGRQSVLVTPRGTIVGKLVELSGDRVVVEKDGGERTTVARAEITAARRRFADGTSPSGDAPTTSPLDDAPAPAPAPPKLPRPGYLGALFRPWICLKSCKGGVVAFGLEGGYKLAGLGVRIGFRDGDVYVSGDMRIFLELAATRWLVVSPMAEVSILGVATKGATVVQVVQRTVFRFGFPVSPGVLLFVEPLALDIGLTTSVFGATTVAAQGASGPSPPALRYLPGAGIQYRF